MVNLPQSTRRGAGALGCLISLVLFATALYYGINIGQVYLRYYQLVDGMRSQARLAPSLQDDVIQRRLVAQADSLLPGRHPQFRITRGGTPKKIIIETVYTDKVDLPLFKHTFVMHPRAEERL
ncbi:MAG TPA: hypothetical protein VE399_02745 [Gemmatimonadales bacterium]|jgi:hypothetical protein|nr:hypothetical protein [Gemmatimonadales bacterium]